MLRLGASVLGTGPMCTAIIGAGAVHAAVREVEAPPLRLELPDDWVPIPRAEILESVDRARRSGADAVWTLRAAWQRQPTLRWFSLPQLLLETRPLQPGDADLPAAPVASLSIGHAGPRAVYTHRATWQREREALRLTLLALTDETALYDAAVASLAPR